MSVLTLSQAEARIAELESKLASKSKISYKVSPKGAIAIYGLGRFPVTLYLSQFNALNAAFPAIAAWVKTSPTFNYSRHDDAKVAALGVVSLAAKGE